MASARRRLPSPHLVDPRLATALSHPLRVHILAILDVRTASPREIAEELGERLNNVGYHIEILENLDCIELVDTRPKHGGRVVEHFYRTSRVPIVNQGTWDDLDPKNKWAVAAAIMRAASQDINESLAAGLFLEPDDNHLSRTTLVVDDRGWEDVKAILNDAMARLLDVRDDVEERIARDDALETMPITVQMFQFRSPDPERDDGAAD